MAQSKRLTKEEIQEDKFINFVLRCYTFLKENIITLSIALAVAIIGIVSYLVYTQNQENQYAEASANFNQAIQTYKDAETNFLDVTEPSETEDDADEEAGAEKVNLIDAAEKQQQLIEKYPNSIFADRARFYYAKSLYHQDKYPEARIEFEKVANTDKPENQIYALYAQKAIGNCYEQEGDYEKAISAYEEREFPNVQKLVPAIRKFVISNAKYNQALCHERLNALEDAKATYKEIIDDFKLTLNAEIEVKSSDLIRAAIEVAALVEQPLDFTKAKQLAAEELYFDSLIGYTDKIREYKVEKDIEGGLLSEIRKRIRRFEKTATTLIKNVRSARKYEKSGELSLALNLYNQIVDFEAFGLNRNLYERALLNYDRLTLAEKRGSNEK